QIMAKWRLGCVTQKLLEKLAEDVKYHQKRNRQTRMSHEKTTRRRLREHGIKLTGMLRCRPSS
ncbi:MAG TPA: hypothetical protein VGL71_05805, partial [Urbifossiella sp.]